MPDQSPATTDCPGDATFADFIAGRLASPDASSVARHLEACADCRELLAALRQRAGTEDAVVREILRAGAATATDVTGTTIDRKYRLLRLLGEGGMGAVYEAEHAATRRRVAVKLIHARLLAAGEDARRRFQREGRAAAAIDGPNLVRVLDAGEDDASGDLYLVMELLRGEDLQHLVDRVGPLSPDAALRVAAQALLGLAEVHARGIVHRDIKPANLFLARSDGGEVTVKLLDFGVAKGTGEALHAAEATGITRTGGLLGSPLYMSPEQTQSSKDIDHRTDIWSLGGVLYCALTGRAPFSHVESVGKLILAICGSAPPPVRDLAPWVPPEVAEVVHGALAIDRTERPPSAEAMLDTLRVLLPDGFTLREEVLTGVSPEVRAAPTPPRERQGAQLDPTISPSESDRGVRRAERRPSSTRARIAALAVLLLGIGAAVRYTTLPAAPHAKLPPGSGEPPSATVPAVSAQPSTTPVRRVTLLISPPDTSVEVDGVRVEVVNGRVDVDGVLGSGHHVRLLRGDAERSADVFVTEKGAVPPILELAGTPDAGGVRAPPAGQKPRPSGPASAPARRAEDIMRSAE
jgi:serine/threonine-protein kinase